MHTVTDATSPRPRQGAGRTDARKLRIGVAGATGYTGQELLRILSRHPGAEITVATSSSAATAGAGAPRRLAALGKMWDGVVTPFDAAALPKDLDLLFLALPDRVAAELAPALVDEGLRVIDLSGAFRL